MQGHVISNSKDSIFNDVNDINGFVQFWDQE